MVKKIDWKCYEYLGVEIHLHDKDREYIRDKNGCFNLEPIISKEVLQPGTQIVVHGLMGELFLMTAQLDAYGKFFAQGEKLIGTLEFGKDDRNAWVCTGLINLHAIKKLELLTKDS